MSLKKFIEMTALKDFLNHLPKVSCHTYDVGNTNPHVATFNNGELTSVRPLEHLEINRDHGIVCSVNKEVNSSKLFQDFTGERFLNMPVHYSKTLGHDRLSLAHFAYNLFPQKEVLIIDAGTFITLDLVNENGFQGGYIIPGPKTLAESYQRGRQLSKANDSLSLNENWPQNTEEAMGQGLKILERGLISEIKKLKGKDTLVFLTGGQRKFLQKELETSIDEDHLLHYALYFQYVNISTSA